MLTARSARDFSQAYGRLSLEWIRNLLTGRPGQLLSWSEVKEALGLGAPVERGVQEIELDRIVGSTSKAHLFTRGFLPKNLNTSDRWRWVDEIFYSRGFAPIEVYQVGDIYFVQDGHHRVSVNRLHGIPTIEARVKAFPSQVPLHKNDTLADIRRRAARYRNSERQR